jgi:membrane-associated phospholipid phosphatase
LGAVALAGALVVGVARIVLGYHDFWDVLAGLIIGMAAGVFIAQSLYFGLFTPH